MQSLSYSWLEIAITQIVSNIVCIDFATCTVSIARMQMEAVRYGNSMKKYAREKFPWHITKIKESLLLLKVHLLIYHFAANDTEGVEVRVVVK